MNKTNPRVLIVGLAVLVLLLVGYIVVDKVQLMYNENLQKAAQSGFSEGLRYALVETMRQSNNCQPVTVTLDNATRTLVDVSCLRQSNTS